MSDDNRVEPPQPPAGQAGQPPGQARGEAPGDARAREGGATAAPDRPAAPAPGAADRVETPVIPLDRARAAARARQRPLAHALLDRPDLARHLPAMPLQEVYYAIKEIGLHDAAELVQFASPAQIRGFLDLDAWRKDQFLIDKAAPWLEALIDAGPEVLARAVEGLDGEVMALYLQRHARVYDLEMDTPPDQPEGHYYPTPDTFYLLDIVAEGEHGKHVEQLVDWLYRADLELGRRVVMSARWELPSELEEYAYRWRAGRMADLGYVDYYEALEVYRFLDPASVKVGEGGVEQPSQRGGLPAELAGALDAQGLLSRALGQIGEPAELERLATALLLLVNRVMAADLVEPGDVEAARAALQRTEAYLDLALELLGRGDPARAAEALRTVPLTRLFRAGFSLTRKLRQAAEALLAQAWVSTRPGAFTLLDPPQAAVVSALHRPRPLYPRVLEGQPGERPFRTLGEIARAARALEEIATIGDTIRRGLGVDPRLLSDEHLHGCVPGPEAITFRVIAATLMANLLLGRPPALVALAPDDLPRLVEQALESGRLRPSARLSLERGFASRLAEREQPPPPVWPELLEGWLRHFEESLVATARGRPVGLLLRVLH